MTTLADASLTHPALKANIPLTDSLFVSQAQRVATPLHPWPQTAASSMMPGIISLSFPRAWLGQGLTSSQRGLRASSFQGRRTWQLRTCTQLCTSSSCLASTRSSFHSVLTRCGALPPIRRRLVTPPAAAAQKRHGQQGRQIQSWQTRQI